MLVCFFFLFVCRPFGPVFVQFMEQDIEEGRTHANNAPAGTASAGSQTSHDDDSIGAGRVSVS
jgi:hypothetical protein